MSRKRHRKVKSHKKKATRRIESSSSGLKYYDLPSPFQGLSQNQSTELLQKLGDKYSEKFEDTYRELQEKILGFDPILLLSSFSFYGLSVPIGSDPELSQAYPILQLHVELLQALILQHRSEKYPFKPILPQDFTMLCKLVQEVTQSFHMRRFKTFESSIPDEQIQRLRTIENMRMHTQAIRNWGYPHQVKRIVSEIFSPLENEIQKLTGIKIKDLLVMFTNLSQLAEDRLNNHLDFVRPIARSKTIALAVERYHHSFSGIKNSPEQLIELAKENSWDLPQFKTMLICHSDLRLSDIYTFKLEDFLIAYPGEVRREDLYRIINSWTLSFGDLKGKDPEHFFLGNPVWQHPIISLKDDLYFWPIMNLFISFCLELIEIFIRPHNLLYEKYKKRRSNYLEDKIEEIFKSAFPNSNIYRGSKWRDPVTKKDFENDLLVLIDSYIILIEAKSGRISETAQRGADKRLQRVIKDLVVDPTVQSERFAKYLREHPGVHRFPNKRGGINEIDTSEVYNIIRLNITLELLAIMSLCWHDLRQAGFIPKEIELAPTMSFAELEIVFDILEGTCEKLHYLIRRKEFEDNAIYIGDEIDLLTFYIDNRFNIGDAEFGKTNLVLWGLSKGLDPYFMSSDTKRHIKKPKLKLSRWWRDILTRIEERHVPRWTELGHILLNIPYKDQVEFKNKFKRVKKYVRLNPRTQERLNAVTLMTGPTQMRDVLVGFAYQNMTKEQRNQYMNTVAGEAIEQASSDRALVIGVDTQRDDYPYSVIACFTQ